MNFVDTNIFIEAFVREGPKSEKSIKYLTDSKNNLCSSWLVLAEFEWVLKSVYKYSRAQITLLLKNLASLKNLDIPDRDKFISAISYYSTYSIDLTDCLNASQIQDKNINIISYDHDFNKLKFLTRLEP